MFDEACRQLKLWQAEGIAPQVLSVNVSGVQFKGASELEREIEASLTRWDVDPSQLELELTESVLMEATQQTANTLENLRQLGTKIAIDDFGTGYSSLKYLTQYPVNRLKLAQEFVFRVTVDYRNAAVVRAAIRLANELGLEVIAEGVETEAQARFLMGAGCEQAQGYYFSRPVPAAKATELLRAGRIEPQARPVAPAHLGRVSATTSSARLDRQSEIVVPRNASIRRRCAWSDAGAPAASPRSGASGMAGSGLHRACARRSPARAAPTDPSTRTTVSLPSGVPRSPRRPLERGGSASARGLPLMRTLPASISRAAPVRVLASRAHQSHLSRRCASMADGQLPFRLARGEPPSQRFERGERRVLDLLPLRRRLVGLRLLRLVASRRLCRAARAAACGSRAGRGAPLCVSLAAKSRRTLPPAPPERRRPLAAAPAEGGSSLRRSSLKPSALRIEANSSPEQPTTDISSGTTRKPPSPVAPVGATPPPSAARKAMRARIRSDSRSSMSMRTARPPATWKPAARQ